MAYAQARFAKIPLSLRTAESGFAGRAGVGLLSASLLTATGGPVFAQENEGGAIVLQPVVVEDSTVPAANPYADPNAPYKVDRSATPFFTQPLLDTAKSIEIIPKEVIQDAGATSLKDVLRTQPGVTLGTGEGGNAYGDRFIIRGFEARNDVFVDGLRDPGVVSREIFAVEQVEVAKGPSSTFAGRGTTGGAVNIVSKMPSLTSFHTLEATVGTADQRRVTLDLNQAFNSELAIRFNGLFQESGVAGRDEVFDDRTGAALAVLYQPTDHLRLSADYYHLDTDALPDWGVPYDSSRNEPFDADRDNFYGLVDRDYWETETDIVSAKIEFDFNEQLTLSSQFRYGVTGNEYVASAPERPDLTAGTVQAIAKTRDQDNEFIGNQTNLIAIFDQGDIRHTVVAGLEITREEITNDTLVVDPRAVTQDLFNPDPHLWLGTITTGDSQGKKYVDTRAVYLMDTVDLSAQWQVFGGLRYDDYDIETTVIPNDYTPEQDQFENSTDFLNWHAGVVYKPLPNGSIYAAFSSSSNPSGEQLDAGGVDYGGITESSAALEPERNKSYEIGTKWNLFAEHLALTLALFQIDKENARVTTGGGQSGLPQVTTLDGEQRVRGVEIGLAGNITPQWSLFGGFTYLDTEILSAANPDDVGKRFPNVADQSFNLQSKYQVTDALAVGGLLHYSSAIYGGTTAALDTSIPSYWRLDLLGEYRFSAQLSAQLNVLNVTDELYYDALYRSSTPFTYVAPGRAAALTVKYEF